MKKEQKNFILTALVFIALFVLSLDFWGWNTPRSADALIFGLPIWIYYLLCLTLLTSVFFYILSVNIWRDEN